MVSNAHTLLPAKKKTAGGFLVAAAL